MLLFPTPTRRHTIHHRLYIRHLIHLFILSVLPLMIQTQLLRLDCLGPCVEACVIALPCSSDPRDARRARSHEPMRRLSLCPDSHVVLATSPSLSPVVVRIALFDMDASSCSGRLRWLSAEEQLRNGQQLCGDCGAIEACPFVLHPVQLIFLFCFCFALLLITTFFLSLLLFLIIISNHGSIFGRHPTAQGPYN